MLFKQVHEHFKLLSMHLFPYYLSFLPVLVQFLQCKYLFSLKLIKVDVDSVGFDNLLLTKVFSRKVIILDDFALLVKFII